MKKIVMTVDVEEWYQVENLKNSIKRKNWNDYESRIENQISVILDLFDRHNVKATFFVLGIIAEKHPDMILKIQDKGHSIASHGYNHELLNEISDDKFLKDIIDSKKILESICNKEITGYRAPAFSIRDSLYIKMFESNYKYDASYMPTSLHDRYGKIKSINIYKPNTINGIKSFPNLSLKIFRFTIPISGGGYFRLFPYFIFKFLFKKAIKKAEVPIFYFHPWEIDPNQPKIKNVPRLSYFRHYNGLKKAYFKLEKLLTDFSFTDFTDYVD